MATESPHDPPFRADHVGSLLRPPELLKARSDRAGGKISAEELRAVEDASIRDVIAFQEGVGLQSITDGEYRREIFYSDFYFRGLGGGTVAYDPSSIDEVYFIDREGHKLPLLVPRVVAARRNLKSSTWIGACQRIRDCTRGTSRGSLWPSRSMK